MCCGSRRSAWRAAPAFPRATASAEPPAPRAVSQTDAATVRSAGDAFPSVKLHYAQTAPVRLRGPVTGRAYDFSGEQPVQAVDVRDAAVFARNPAFRREAS